MWKLLDTFKLKVKFYSKEQVAINLQPRKTNSKTVGTLSDIIPCCIIQRRGCTSDLKYFARREYIDLPKAKNNNTKTTAQFT